MVAPGVDVRGEGGMVLAPPSVKEGVGRYRFLNWGTAGAYAPEWLLELVDPQARQGSGGRLPTIGRTTQYRQTTT